MANLTAEAGEPARAGVATTRDSRGPIVLMALAFFFLWLEVVHQLQGEWSFNPQYSYGWTVPFLAAFLFFQRWSRRPAPGATHFRFLTITLMVLAAGALFPARLIAVANPDWRLLDWMMTLAAVVISLGALQLAGGERWLRHFAFPILFFLVATPWPTQFEQFVVQHLMRADAAITIQVLNLAGIVAIQHGNVIELSTGQVGIDDACTGVRSLQATFMISLFLGEFYWMRLRQRFLLIVAAGGLAFFCNLARTFVLCEVAANSGIAAIHRWHDPAGLSIFFICLFLLWGMSFWLRPDHSAEPALPVPFHFTSVRFPLALLAWFALTEIAVATWYRPGLAQIASAPWTIAWPTSELDYQPQPVAAAAEVLLQSSDGGAATWRSSNNDRWMMYSFHWLPGRTAALFLKNHRPDICLPASGLTMVRETGIHLLTINGINLPIRSYRFDDNGQPLHIFYCYWNGRSSYVSDASATTEDWTARGRLHAAWQGKRELGARMFELAVWGHENDAQATAALQRELEKIVRPH
ncbi:MAG TPA: exosortase/archaeosortase family protein [Chthoniobacterales bacterium]|nr:exosortase/archaeosortase family protein [Chthoniobacterales bacterium]